MNTDFKRPRTQDEIDFAAEVAEGMLNGDPFEKSILTKSDMNLIISELRKDPDIQFALRLVQEGTKAEDVEDICNTRHIMGLALAIHQIETS